MEWSKNYIENILADLADENPFACRALLKISRVVYTQKVPTIAVSLRRSPDLLINKKFIDKYAKTENDIKALLMHEFLHVILGHTEKYERMTPLLNIALDAVINSIIHRTYGCRYSNLFKELYKPIDIECLLRPVDTFDESMKEWEFIHREIYKGNYAADDLFELIEYLLSKKGVKVKSRLIFIGNHDGKSKRQSKEMKKILEEILKKMDGTKIWNNRTCPGIGDKADLTTRKIRKLLNEKWIRSTQRILKKCLVEDKKISRETSMSEMKIPVLSTGDRRAAIISMWLPIIPMSRHVISKRSTGESVNIYFDVSGSMEDEINALISLLFHFRHRIRKPLWVFSNEVSKAVFKDGMLEYDTTGGTSISCVFNHIRENKYKKILIVTDGFVETITEEMLWDINKKDLRVLISSKGDPSSFEEHQIINYQLEELNL